MSKECKLNNGGQRGLAARKQRGTARGRVAWVIEQFLRLLPTPHSLLLYFFLLPLPAFAQDPPRRASVCVLDFGAAGAEREATAGLAQGLAAQPALTVNDRDESRAAARGAGYKGSLNLSLEEARDLGGALGCDFYLLGRTATEARSTLARPRFFESYAAILLVSSRAGRLIQWDTVSVEEPNAERAAAALPEALIARAGVYAAAIGQAQAQEKEEESQRLAPVVARLEEVADADSLTAEGLRLPAPYRRLTPVYPATAAQVKASGTVDVLVTLDAAGEVQKVAIARWVGFGLEEETSKTVRQMHFRPAMRDGVAIPLRVLLRYNFRPQGQ